MIEENKQFWVAIAILGVILIVFLIIMVLFINFKKDAVECLRNPLNYTLGHNKGLVCYCMDDKGMVRP